jgi:hypothetical protein
MQNLLASLTALHPLLPWGLLTLAIWLSAYVFRKLVPKLWELPAALALRESAFQRFPDLRPALSFLWSVWQGLPSVLLGALVGAWQLGSDPGAAWKGAIAGALAPALHHVLKALPFIPYRGELGGTSRVPPLPPGFVLVLALGLLQSCSNWKPAARTVNDVARELCSLFFAERQSISLEEAAKTACETREQLDPWIEQVLAAKQAAGAAATK